MSFIADSTDKILNWTGVKDLYCAGSSAYEGEFTSAGKFAASGLLKAAFTATAVYASYLTYTYMTASEIDEPPIPLQQMKWDKCLVGSYANSTMPELPKCLASDKPVPGLLPVNWKPLSLDAYSNPTELKPALGLIADRPFNVFDNSSMSSVGRVIFNSTPPPSLNDTLTCLPQHLARVEPFGVSEVAVTVNPAKIAPALNSSLLSPSKVVHEQFAKLLGDAKPALPDWNAERIVSHCNIHEMCPNLEFLKDADFTDPVQFPLSEIVQDTIDSQYLEHFTNISPDATAFFRNQMDHGYLRSVPVSKLKEIYGTPDKPFGKIEAFSLRQTLKGSLWDLAKECTDKGICTSEEQTANFLFDAQQSANDFSISQASWFEKISWVKSQIQSELGRGIWQGEFRWRPWGPTLEDRVKDYGGNFAGFIAEQKKIQDHNNSLVYRPFSNVLDAIVHLGRPQLYVKE